MTFPTIIVEFSPGTGPFDTPTWIELTGGGPHGNRVENLTWTWGRQRDLDEWPPGEATIVLSNEDRLFDPDYSAGTYSGQLLPRVPFRIRATHGATTYDLFYGFVENGWEQGTPDDPTCTVRLVDLLAVLAGYPLPSVADAEILADSPLAYWPLAEQSGTVMRDGSGNRRHGEYLDGTAELSEELSAAGQTVVRGIRFDGAHYGLAPADNALLAALDPPLVVELVATLPSSDGHAIAFGTGTKDSLGGRWFRLFLDSDGSIGASLGGQYTGDGFGATGTGKLGSAPRHVVYRKQLTADLELYVDGEDVTDSTGTYVPLGTALPPKVVIGARKTQEADGALNGALLAHVAIFRTLTPTRIAAHADAVLNPLGGLRSDEQLDWILDQIGVPDDLRDLDTGDVKPGPIDTTGRDALTLMREIAATEQGALYIDHANGGVIRFEHRYARILDTRSATEQAAFSDDTSDTDAIRYENLQIEPNGIASVINQVEVTWQGGSETVSDSTSVGAYGPQSRTITTQASTPNMARSVGELIVGRYAEPLARIRSLEVNPGAEHVDNDFFATLLALQISDRVGVRRHPRELGTADDRDAYVEGITHTVQDGLVWRTSYYLTDVDPGPWFIWGTSKWGESTRWGA